MRVVGGGVRGIYAHSVSLLRHITLTVGGLTHLRSHHKAKASRTPSSRGSGSWLVVSGVVELLVNAGDHIMCINTPYTTTYHSHTFTTTTTLTCPPSPYTHKPHALTLTCFRAHLRVLCMHGIPKTRRRNQLQVCV